MPHTPLVTLIVPTVHHRAALYARSLRYFSGIGFSGPIVVSDHSPEEHAGVIAEATRKHPGLDLKLLRHAPELHFLERLSQCAKSAQTPYVHLHADDDFIVLPTLDKLVERMQRDPACSAAMGINLHVKFEGARLTALSKAGHAQAGAFDRLASQLESYSSALYALRRRDELITTFEFTVRRCPDVQFWQYLESCVAALHGSLVVLEELHYVRSEHQKKWSHLLVKEQRSPDHFPYLILSPAFQDRVAAFRAALLEACAAAGASVDAARLDNGLIHLLSRGLRAMGLPEKSTRDPAGRSPEESAQAVLARTQNLRDPAGAAMQRIFEVATG